MNTLGRPRRLLPLAVPLLLVAIVGCGDSESTPAGSSESTPAVTSIAPSAATASGDALVTTSIAPTTDVVVTVAPDATSPATTAGEPVGQPIDPASLEPGTAQVRVEGQLYLFRRTSSMQNFCELSPAIEFGTVEMDAIGVDEGGPHLQIETELGGDYLVIGIPPSVGYYAGVGEVVEQYVDFAGYEAPLLDIAAEEGAVAAVVEVVNAFSGEVVPLVFAVRC